MSHEPAHRSRTTRCPTKGRRGAAPVHRAGAGRRGLSSDPTDGVVEVAATREPAEPMSRRRRRRRAGRPGRRDKSRSTRSRRPCTTGALCSRRQRMRPSDSSWAGVGASGRSRWSPGGRVLDEHDFGHGRSVGHRAERCAGPQPRRAAGTELDHKVASAGRDDGTPVPLRGRGRDQAGPGSRPPWRARHRRTTRARWPDAASEDRRPRAHAGRERRPRPLRAGGDRPRRDAGSAWRWSGSSSRGRPRGGAVPILLRYAFRPCVPPPTSLLAERLSVPVAQVAVGGRSFGGRMCSMAAAEGLQAGALVLVSYPLAPAGAARIGFGRRIFPDLGCRAFSSRAGAMPLPRPKSSNERPPPSEGRSPASWSTAITRCGRRSDVAGVVAAWLAALA